MLLKLHIKNNFLTGKNRTRCSQNNKTPCITRHATNLQTKRRLYGNVQPPFCFIYTIYPSIYYNLGLKLVSTSGIRNVNGSSVYLNVLPA